MSKVMQLLETVWESSGPTYEQTNHAMSDALKLAVCYGFKFEEEDFIEIARRFRPFYWMGNSWGSELGEMFYSFACQKQEGGRARTNKSAAIAFEKWKKRKPFIHNGKRLSVGEETTLQEYGRVWVTDIRGDVIRLASYKSDDNPGGLKRGKPKKLFAIKHKNFKATMKGGKV